MCWNYKQAPPYSVFTFNDIKFWTSPQELKVTSWEITASYADTFSLNKCLTKASRSFKSMESVLEQSDFIINERNIKLQYITPSIAKFNKRNLNLSHQYESPSNSNTG